MKSINSVDLTTMALNEFRELFTNHKLTIIHHGKPLCEVVECAKETKNMKVVNFSSFTRGSKKHYTDFFKKKGAVVKLITNAHKQKVAYLIPSKNT